jgi:hypothetical protein
MEQIKIYLVPVVITGVLIFLFTVDFIPERCRAAATGSTLCADIEKRYDTVLSAAGGACRSNTDCGCYGPVSKKSVCGGVTDKQTTIRLNDLVQEFRRAGCDWHIRCAPWLCNPVCERGRCIRGMKTNLSK